jgi:hypothetical protein
LGSPTDVEHRPAVSKPHGVNGAVAQALERTVQPFVEHPVDESCGVVEVPESVDLQRLLDCLVLAQLVEEDMRDLAHLGGAFGVVLREAADRREVAGASERDEAFIGRRGGEALCGGHDCGAVTEFDCFEGAASQGSPTSLRPMSSE